MIYLYLSIALTSALFWIFRWHANVGKSQLTLVSTNYIVAASSIALFNFYNGVSLDVFNESYSWYAFALGLSFVFTFLIIAKSTKIIGVSTTAMASKLSVILTILLSILFLNDSLNLYKVIALITAVLAIVLVNEKTETKVGNKALPWMVLIFSGAVDFILAYLSNKSNLNSYQLTQIIFSAAAIGSIIYSLIIRIRIIRLDLVIGIILGLVNVASIYTYLQSFKGNLEPSFVFLYFSIGVLLFSSLGSILFFKEKFSSKKWIGLTLSVLSLLLLYKNV